MDQNGPKMDQKWTKMVQNGFLKNGPEQTKNGQDGPTIYQKWTKWTKNGIDQKVLEQLLEQLLDVLVLFWPLSKYCCIIFKDLTQVEFKSSHS